MKKLYIGLILLFVFLSFVPQITLGDSIVFLSSQEKQEIEKRTQKELQCLYEKKLKLPKKYAGPNIKLETIPYKGTINFRTPFDYPSTKILYFCGLQNCYNRVISSVVNNCNEYVVLKTDNFQGFRGNRHVYNITEVPPGSYLKYLPKTNELKILPPLEDLQQTLPPIESKYKEIVKNQSYKAELEYKLAKKREFRNQKIKETIKQICSVIGILLGSFVIAILVIIIIRKTIKKLKP